MNLKDLIFGGGVKSGGDGGTYRDSIQAWLPIKNIIGGVVITKDGRFVKILELLPVNIYLKSPNDRQNIISSFAAYLKIAPNDLQMVARTLPADTQAYVEQMQRYAEKEDNEACREMIEDRNRDTRTCKSSSKSGGTIPSANDLSVFLSSKIYNGAVLNSNRRYKRGF